MEKKIEEVRRALKAIPSRPPYDEWIRIIAAVLDAVNGDKEVAESLLKEWSPEEEPGEYRYKLDNGLERVKAGTLFYGAEKHSYAPEPKKDANDENKKTTQAQRLLQLAQGAELFHSPEGSPYATFPVRGARKTRKITSSDFEDFLVLRFLRSEGRAPADKALNQAIKTLAARAKLEGEEKEVHLRTAIHDGAIYIDLADAEGRVVEVTPQGWRVITDPPVKFRQPEGMKPMPVPERGGDLSKLCRHAPIQDNKSFALLLAYLVMALRPEGPYPVLSITGEQGLELTRFGGQSSALGRDRL